MKKFLLLTFILLSLSLAIFSRLKFNGFVYGFDFGIFHPDGVHYTSKTFQLMGVDPILASQEISKWYSNNSIKIESISPQEVIDLREFYPRGRLLYPLLSVPFVHIFGISGMLAVPILSFILLMVSICYLGLLFNRLEIAIVLALILSISPTVLRWMINDCSDALFVALISLVPFITLLKKESKRLILFSIVILAASLTRFSLTIFLAIAVIQIFQKRIRDSIAVIGVSVCSNIPALTETNRFFLGATDANFWEKLIHLPVSAVKVGFIEISQLAALDRLLLYFLALALLLAFLNIKKISSRYLIAVFLSVWVLGAINGTLGVNFRFQMPVLFFCCWVILDSLPRLIVAPGAHIKVEKA